MLKFLVMKYIRDSANTDTVVSLLWENIQTDIVFPGHAEMVEKIKDRLRELGELDVLREFEKGSFSLYP